MFSCQNLLHPFQNDPGTSQRQRVIDQLLSDSVKIDGRSLAGLLNYFSDLSAGINYYDRELAVNDWQPFFRQSLPFLLASISNYDYRVQQEKFEFYKLLFVRGVSASGLQLIIHFIYYNTIYKIDSWYEAIREHDLPVRNTLEELIRNKLSGKLKTFIGLANASAKWYGIKRIDFTPLQDTAESNIWGMSLRDIHSINNDFRTEAVGSCEQLKALYDQLVDYFPLFIEGIKLLGLPAEDDISASLVPVGTELKKNHAPHLALIFAFIRLFQKMQGELNKKTKEHLKYFYTEVLKITPRDAEPDKANIVFEVQKILQDQYQKYRLTKGTELNGGRDEKNADIVFETDEEIIVNETQVAEVRTLFLNNELVADRSFVEGAYIAPLADKADGVDKDFKDDDPHNWFTLGRNISKYLGPGKKLPQPHPQARLGFVLASPVLYLKEGTRTVDITIDCRYETSICKNLQNDCQSKLSDDCPEYPDIYPVNAAFFDHIKNFLTDPITNKIIPYVVISAQLLDEAVAGGMSVISAQAIRNRFLTDYVNYNLCTGEYPYEEFTMIEYTVWAGYLATTGSVETEVNKLPDLFKKRYPFKIYFSGEKEWLEPSSVESLQLVTGAGTQFNFLLTAKLEADKPAVTFYNKENLGEDLSTQLPVVRIELDDMLKFKLFLNKEIQPDCCLEKVPLQDAHYVSLYHFFRNVKVHSNTKIDVTVCGLKNFIVQNDENVMDVNSIVFPFGTRPKVGASFYVSSKEIFCKNWTEFGIRFKWKDLPDKLEEYYHGYEDFLTGINNADFKKANYSYFPMFLQKGIWIPNAPLQKGLFVSDAQNICSAPAADEQYYHFVRGDFGLAAYTRTSLNAFRNEILTNSSREYFLRLILFDPKGLAFHHSRYSYILARQMMALGKWPEIYIGPVYDGIPFPPPVGPLPVLNVDEVFEALKRSYEFSTNIRNRSEGVLQAVQNAFSLAPGPLAGNLTLIQLRSILQNPLPPGPGPVIYNNLPNPLPAVPQPVNPDAAELNPFLLLDIIQQLEDNVLAPVYNKLKDLQDKRVVIPNEPYTPQIQGMTIDYKASAELVDIDLIHLYPYKGTHKTEEIELQPTLFPTFCDEGTLFIGLKNLQPANNLNILFQLAEATADSETEAEKVHWHYLDHNVWKPLRTGFEVLADGTLNLTSTGIIKFSLPENMNKDNTVMPSGVHWIKASMAKNSRSSSETIAIHTQAMTATFALKEGNDKNRLDTPLPEESIAKLLVADPAIKTVNQPYETFGGKLTELDGGYYLRVSELLRHKGRAIQKWDYERLVLEKFSQFFKAKCINHSFHTNAHTHDNDVPYAPGYVMLALIPDLTKMKAGNSFEPKVPASLLEAAEQYLKKVASPFVRLKAVNPRYEKVHFCLTIRLIHGKDKTYFKEKLKVDLGEFLAPWAIGKYDKLAFGQCVYRSDILRFLEQTGYVDYVKEFRMTHENNPAGLADQPSVCPVSPRSILLAGGVDVIIDEPVCEKWCEIPAGIKACEGPALVQDYCK